MLEAHSASITSAVVVPLAFGFAIIPITNALLDEVGASGDYGLYYKLTSAIADLLRAISASAPAAYIEAEFFGGVGGQGAAVWSNDQYLLVPTHDAQAINIALRLLGVPRGTSHDELEAIGLPRHRGTNGWLKGCISK